MRPARHTRRASCRPCARGGRGKNALRSGDVARAESCDATLRHALGNARLASNADAGVASSAAFAPRKIDALSYKPLRKDDLAMLSQVVTTGVERIRAGGELA